MDSCSVEKSDEMKMNDSLETISPSCVTPGGFCVANHNDDYLVRLNSHCCDVWLCPQTCLWVVVNSTACFFSAIVFDISGDRNGWLIAVLLFSLPVLLYPMFLRALYYHRFFDIFGAYTERMSGTGVELTVKTAHTSPLYASDEK